MIAHAWTRWLEPAQQLAAEENPFAMFAGWDSDRLVWLAVLIPVAVAVLFIGRRRFKAQLGAGMLRPQGRNRYVPLGGGPRRSAQWRDTIARLEASDPTPIGQARSGPVRVCGEIISASGNLGGAKGRECVWRNRAGAGPMTAVAAELIVIADESGQCGVESLEGARVIAPTDTISTHYESESLQIGDRIEVIATFDREVVGEHDDPSQLVYGTLGADGHLDIRVVNRPEAAPQTEQSPEPDEPDEP